MEVRVGETGEGVIGAIARRLGEVDSVGHRLGIALEELRPGYARLAMTVDDSMVGGHGVCHGPFTFALADTAVGYACASRNVTGLSQGGDLLNVAPARQGDRLVAEASEAMVQGRTAVYDVRVSNQNGATIAMLRGRCRLFEGTFVPA